MAVILGAATLAVIVVMAGLILGFLFNFHHPAPKLSYAAPRSPLEAQRQDLDYFAQVLALDRAFSPAGRATAEGRLAALMSLPEALPAPRLHVALMQVMALADNGHTRMDATSYGALVLPLRVTAFAEGFYVTRAPAAYRDMLGGRVTSIDGQDFARILPQLETLRGGVDGFRRANAALYIVVQDLLYGLGIAADPTASTWAVTLPDGQVVTHRLLGYQLQRGDELPSPDRWLSPEPGAGVEKDWVSYRPQAAEVPETWRHFEEPFRVARVAGSCAQEVRLRSIGDSGPHRIEPFLQATEVALRARPPCAVILDLRGDGGGDYTKIWKFTHALPGLVLPGGQIFVLTDSLTFSAAITTVAFVKDAGKARVTIIGEPVGDRLAFYSEGGKACLPNLKVCMYYQRGKHDYAHACTQWRECFWLNWFYPVRVKSLQPDVVVPLSFKDWSEGRDAAELKARELASRDLR